MATVPMKAERELVSEPEQVETWRRRVLEQAGYPKSMAVELAVRTDVDLHRAVEMLEAGCDPVTALEILL